MPNGMHNFSTFFVCANSADANLNHNWPSRGEWGMELAQPFVPFSSLTQPRYRGVICGLQLKVSVFVFNTFIIFPSSSSFLDIFNGLLLVTALNPAVQAAMRIQKASQTDRPKTKQKSQTPFPSSSTAQSIRGAIHCHL